MNEGSDAVFPLRPIPPLETPGASPARCMLSLIAIVISQGPTAAIAGDLGVSRKEHLRLAVPHFNLHVVACDGNTASFLLLLHTLSSSP